MAKLFSFPRSGPGPRSPFFEEPFGRPGDWFEPIGVVVGPRSALMGLARRRGLPAELVFTLLVERELLIERVSAACGSDDLAALKFFGSDGPLLGPGTPMLPYIRALRAGQRAPRASECSLAVPIRLLSAVGEVLGRVLEEPELDEKFDEARSWEIAAAAEGKTMCEWAALRVLAAKRPAVRP